MRSPFVLVLLASTVDALAATPRPPPPGAARWHPLYPALSKLAITAETARVFRRDLVESSETRDASAPAVGKYCKYDVRSAAHSMLLHRKAHRSTSHAQAIRAMTRAARERSYAQGRDGCCGKAASTLGVASPPAGSPWSRKG